MQDKYNSLSRILTSASSAASGSSSDTAELSQPPQKFLAESIYKPNDNINVWVRVIEKKGVKSSTQEMQEWQEVVRDWVQNTLNNEFNNECGEVEIDDSIGGAIKVRPMTKVASI